MVRHSKNNTANPIFTYHERKKVNGVLKERLGKDSMRKVEDCWICLKFAENPVSTPDGYIFCKMCILNNFIMQKKKYAEIKKEYDNYIKELKRKKKNEYIYEKEKEKKKFMETFENINQDTEKEKNEKKENKIDISNNFWIVNNLKTNKDINKKLKPPSKKLICPISKNTLSIKDLITIYPEVLTKNDSTKKIWVCSFSKKGIYHNKAVLIKKTGQIILKSFFDEYIYGKQNSLDIAINNKEDFIELQTGGTAFCSHNNVENKLYREVLL